MLNSRSAVHALCVALLFAGGCSSIKVRYTYDTEMDLERLKTYAWLPHTPESSEPSGDSTAMNPGLADRIRSDVDEQLARKGLHLDPKNPDFLVTYHVTVEDKINVDDWGYSYSARTRYRSAKGFGIVEVKKYEKGTLILDFVAPDTMKLLWRGEAQGGLDPKRTPKEGAKTVDRALAKILKDFPPPAHH